MLSITEAAEAAGKDRRTIRRHLDAGKFPGAVQVETPTGPAWRLPVDELLAAGITLHAPTPPDDGRASQPLDGLAELRAERDDWRRRAEVAEARVELLEQVAAERGEHLADLRRLIAPITAVPPTPAVVPLESTEGRTEDRRPRWWRRG